MIKSYEEVKLNTGRKVLTKVLRFNYCLELNNNKINFKTEEERDNFLKQYDNPLIETAKKKIKK